MNINYTTAVEGILVHVETFYLLNCPFLLNKRNKEKGNSRELCY
jgi:hypothetical protein